MESAKDDYRAAVNTLNGVNGDLNAATTSSFDTNQDLIKLRELERKAQSNRLVYEAFLVRAKETAEQENISTPNARIIADAAVPHLPSFPPRALLLLAAGILGLFVGILAAILRDLSAGMFAVRAATSPAGTAKEEIASGLVMVASADDPVLSRQAALEMARDAISVNRKAIFIDLAADAPSDIAGFAELAAGKMQVSDVIRVGRKSRVQMLNAGRKDAIANFSRDHAEAVLRAIMNEYDDVVINAGALDAGLTVLADAVAEYSRQVVLAVRDGASAHMNDMQHEGAGRQQRCSGFGGVGRDQRWN